MPSHVYVYVPGTTLYSQCIVHTLTCQPQSMSMLLYLLFNFCFDCCWAWRHRRSASLVKEGMVLRVLSEHHLSQQVAVLLPSSLTFSRPRKQVRQQ